MQLKNLEEGYLINMEVWSNMECDNSRKINSDLKNINLEIVSSLDYILCHALGSNFGGLKNLKKWPRVLKGSLKQSISPKHVYGSPTNKLSFALLHWFQ